MLIVTIWNTYGPYHIARVNSLERIFKNSDIMCFSHCSSQEDYSFFNLKPKNHIVLVNRKASELRFINSFNATVKALLKCRPDLILTCGYQTPETFASLVWAKLFNKSIFLMLDNQGADSPRNKFVELVKSFYLRFFDGFIYGGDSHKNYLLELGVPINKIVHGYNCVDNDAINSGVKAAHNSSSNPVSNNDYFLCVARLIPKKNLPTLIYAYAEYFRQTEHHKKPWSLVICGDGPEYDLLSEMIKKLGISNNVILVGLVSDFNQMLRYYAFARTLILPSKENEQWGLVVNEAMASGLPVLVSNQCGCSSSLVKDFENGFSFDPKSLDQLSKHLIWLHSNEKLLVKMGQRSKEIIREFSPDNFARNVSWLYQARLKRP